ncbi:TonB-dependent receptor [Luteimonas suaedae]|uniref:TonB-dependent receptor n=1 Tax=Luteimonas suaedae TaxID=2605430 RepID=UPI0011EF1391|nr:TonB-dependent receptor [Luteimonas suaedae]
MRNLKRAALCAALCVGLNGVAHAQSNAAGSIYGTVEPGSTVVISRSDTGFRREIQADASGRYRVPSLPVGEYEVTVTRGGQAIGSRSVQVLLGGGADVSFARASDNVQDFAAVTVTGTAASYIDVSNTDTRVVFTAEDLRRIAVGNNIEAVAMLTPGVVAADSRYTNASGAPVQSFGGSAASENATYINGYPVTNPLTNLGRTTLPFNGISQYQAFIGGYGAEFGRATGGVENIITQRGTNEWNGGLSVTWTPESLRADQRNIYYPLNGTENDGLLYQNLAAQTDDQILYGGYVSGPIVKDKLFFYASAEFTDRERETYSARGSNQYYERDYEVPRWLAKVDWHITDDHLLELTAVSDVTKQTAIFQPYNYNTNQIDWDAEPAGYEWEDGGELYIGRYTGYLTDNLTLSALYGRQKQDHIENLVGYDPSVVYVSDARNIPNQVQHGQFPQIAFPDAFDETEGGRLDLDWQLGNHGLRLGYDRIDSTSRAGEQTSGPGYRWLYESVGPGAANDTIPGSGGASGPGGNGDYVVRYIYANGGTFEVKQYAYYFEDRWQINDRWLLSLGVRNENFENYNADGIIYVEQKNQWAPRIGATWDVHGDSSLKVFANVGRYHLAMPNNVARRGAAGSLYTQEYFAFTGIDPTTGEPLGLTALGDGPHSSNNEFGQAPNPLTVAAKDIDSHYQDEFAIGFEKALGDKHIFGARYIYRDLKSAIDDMCDYRPAYAWAIRNGYSEDIATEIGDSLAHCRLFNPGEDNTFVLDDADGNLYEVPLTAGELRFPKLKRSYQGIDLFLERPFDGTWYYKLDYTFSRNYGNAEGQLKSDVGQTDVSMTMDWDHPELMEHANGYLPNDRRHYVKAYGFYQMNPEWRFSATMSVHSGRPNNCTGVYNGPSLDVSDEFRDVVEYKGPYYRYCNGEPSSRGSAGRLPWTGKLDLGVAWSPAFLDHKLMVGFDVFNVTDSQPVQSIIEYGEIGAAGNPYHSTQRPISYQAPRTGRLTVRYDF